MSLHLDAYFKFTDGTHYELNCIPGSIRDIFVDFLENVLNLEYDEYINKDFVINTEHEITALAHTAANYYDDIDIIEDSEIFTNKKTIAIDEDPDADHNFYVLEIAVGDKLQSKIPDTPENREFLLSELADIMEGKRLFGKPISDVEEITFSLA